MKTLEQIQEAITIGKNIREAREARGISGTTLASMIGVTRQAVSSFETGKKKPGIETLRRISQCLSLPLDYFSQIAIDADIEENLVFYRSLKSAKKKARVSSAIRAKWVTKIFQYLTNFIDFPNVNFPSFSFPKDPVEISFEKIEDLAKQVRRHWGLKDSPIDNVTDLLESNGVIIASFPFEEEKLDAFSYWEIKQKRPFIFVNKNNISAVRFRFNVLHELGHLIMHKNVDKEYLLKENQKFKLIEKQANYFAGAFLFPQERFIEEILVLKLDYLVCLKSRWKLSIAAMVERAFNLELINDEEKSRLHMNISRRKWKKSEPLDNEIKLERPSLLKSAFELIINECVETISDVLCSLKLYPYEIEELASLRPGFLGGHQSNIISLKPNLNSENSPVIGKGKVVNFPFNS